MSYQEQDHFVAAAIVAAELYRAQIVAQEITLTASNAKALAIRAGSSAAGFSALTDFIDELARKTIHTSQHVNRMAVEISKIVAQIARTESTLKHFEIACKRAADAEFINTIRPAQGRVQKEYDDMKLRFHEMVWKLKEELNNIERELRTGVILSVMSRVEATQAGAAHQTTLHAIAENVASASGEIRRHVAQSQQRFAHIH